MDAVVSMLESAWRKLRVFSDAEITRFIESVDARDAGFRWHYRETVGGWCLEQETTNAARGLYTLRHSENADFPFAAWSQMLAGAQRILASSQISATETNSAVKKRQAGPNLKLREKHSLHLTLPLLDSKRPLPEAASRLFTTTLDRILREGNLGQAEVFGASSTQGDDGSYVTTENSVSVEIKGDIERGVQIIRDTLWWAGAPESVRLSRMWSEEIPLGLMQPAEESLETCLQVGELRTVQWKFKGKECFRFDRVPFDEPRRHTLRTVLAAVGAEGPDEDGWFIVTLPDGGLIRLCFRRLDEDPDLNGGTVTVRRWTAEAAEFLYRFLEKSELMLLPMAIATTEAATKTITAPWPNVRFVGSASELHGLLASGPHEWWLNSNGGLSP